MTQFRTIVKWRLPRVVHTKILTAESERGSGFSKQNGDFRGLFPASSVGATSAVVGYC